ncbi:hypothetical protein [Streptomyces lavendulae]|uniref:hypothetical protein n=1 Tax=Streptomyces lavendulae TaxID=1914 RepID=UPI0024A109E6|nr:hypothetical protein [Streptomyces lavendulae]GLW00900.1 hypothetical protein Slala05_45310 [Streptomyces lavendulae subsp. lavendulae]
MPDNINERRWKALQARMDADAARRHAARLAVKEAAKEAADDKLRATIDEAVRTAVQGLLGGGAELTESVPQPSPEAPAAAEAGPLYEMEPGAWQAHASRYWADRMAPKYRPMTMGEFLGAQADGDGAA